MLRALSGHLVELVFRSMCNKRYSGVNTQCTPPEVFHTAEPALTPTPTAALAERGSHHRGSARGRDIVEEDIVDQVSKTLLLRVRTNIVLPALSQAPAFPPCDRRRECLPRVSPRE
jgi:hypothetical protein